MKRLTICIVSKLNKLGIKITRSFRYPQSTLNLLDIVIPFLMDKNPEPFFVQIGASDGVTSDPIQHLVKQYKLKGLFVEPLRDPFQKLKQNYVGVSNLIFKNIAVATVDGNVDLFVPQGRESNIHVSQKASFLINHSEKHFKKRSQTKISVPSLTLKSLLEKHSICCIDLLQIDTEGFDFEIIKQCFESEIFPTIINFESLHLTRLDMEECRKLLTLHGYHYSESTMNTFAIKLANH